MVILYDLNICLNEGPLLKNIIYRGEGNSSLVIALKSETKVLRLLKKNGKLLKFSCDNHVQDHLLRTIKFIHQIMRPIINRNLIETPELIHLRSSFVHQLNALVKDSRPSHRLSKTLMLDDQYALVMNDLCSLPASILSTCESYLCGPVLSIEIKPKQGFMPIISGGSPSTSCLYSRAQYLKLSRGRISRMSKYCPLDLFSGCPQRMRGAIRNLIHTPQNNFRLFKDLVLVYGESKTTKFSLLLEEFFNFDTHNFSFLELEDLLTDLIVQSLLVTFTETPDEVNLDDKMIDCPDSICVHHNQDDTLQCKDCKHELPKGCALWSVLRAQKLDTIGPKKASEMLDWISINTKKGPHIIDLLNKPDHIGSADQLPSENNFMYHYRKIWEFLVSLTAKDCSIIITMKRIQNNAIHQNHPGLKYKFISDKQSGSQYIFSIGITDLDQKSPYKIKRICENHKLMSDAKQKYDLSNK